MRYLASIFIFAFLSGCHHHQNFEIAEMAQEVLEQDQGVDIQISPQEKLKKSK